MHGVLHLELDGQLHELHPGQVTSAPPGSPHRFYNPDHEKIIFHVKVVPARRFEQMLRISYGLARDGKVRGTSGIPRNILDLAVIFQLGETYLNGIPIGLQKGIFGTLYRIAKWRGVEKRLLNTYCR